MIKTLARQIKEYKRASLVTPIFMILEVAMEMVIPLLMASIIDAAHGNRMQTAIRYFGEITRRTMNM